MSVNGYELLVCPACGAEGIRLRKPTAQPCRCGERVQAYELERGLPIATRGVFAGSPVALVGEAASQGAGTRA